MKTYRDIFLTSNSTIKDALKIIDSGAMRIALIVDKDENLLGTLSDGDIRRGLLNNLSLSDSIESIIFKTPTVCTLDDSKNKILEMALSKKVYQIPIVDKNGKVIGIEEVDTLLKTKSKSNQVVLMVGGLGTRLRPLTKTTPKPMLNVGGKPILQTIVEKFVSYGFINIIMCVGYKSNIIQNYFEDGSRFGANIEYVIEEKRMGTVGALTLLTDKQKPNEPFFVMNGDLLTNVNFESMLAFHLQNESQATMCVRKYDFQVPYGVVEVENSQIKSIIEKPIHHFFVSAGIYVLNPNIINFIPNNLFYDMPTLFEDMIKKNKKTVSFPLREYWLDIGHIEEYERANIEYNEVF